MTARDDAYEARIGVTLSVAAPGVLANDVNPFGTPLAAVKLSDPDKGVLTAFGSNGGFTYQPPPALTATPFTPVLRNSTDLVDSAISASVLIDLDGDGKPEVVTYGFNHVIHALHAATGAVYWRFDGSFFTGCTPYTGAAVFKIAAADIDDDGKPEVVVPGSCVGDNGTMRVFALNGQDGTMKWVSPPLAAIPVLGDGTTLTSRAVPTIARLRAGESPSILINVQEANAHRIAVDGNGNAIVEPACRLLAESVPDGTYQPSPDFPPHYQHCRGVIVLDGATGAVRQRMIVERTLPSGLDGGTESGGLSAPVVVDLDGDGIPEIVAGGVTFNLDGTLRWKGATAAVLEVAVGNFDDTPDVEVVRYEHAADGGESLAVYKEDGTVLWRLPFDASTVVSKLTVGDLDGSGHPSIVFNSVYGLICAIDHRGLYRWCYDTVVNGVSRVDSRSRYPIFDFDGDGVAEVVVQTTQAILFLDGASGKVKATWPITQASTGSGLPPPPTDGVSYHPEAPIVADVDGDGHADLVFLWTGNDFAATGRLTVLKGQNNDWRPARPVQNQFAYHVTNVNDDGRIPAAVPPPGGFGVPRTNVFGTQAQVLSPVDPREHARTSFTYKATHGAVESPPATVTIDLLPSNRPPSFDSVAPIRYFQHAPFSYHAHASDPDLGDVVHYSLVNYTYNGGSCAIDAVSGALTCSDLQTPTALVVIAATDTQGATALQTLSMQGTTSSAPVPLVIGQPQAVASALLVAAGFTLGPVNSVTNNAPAGQVIAQSPAGSTPTLVGELVSLTVSAGPPPGSSSGPPPALGDVVRIVVAPSSTTELTGKSLAYKAFATNADGTGVDATTAVTWASSVPSVAGINASGTATTASAGTTVISATYDGLVGTASLRVKARTASDSTDPVAAITAPADGATVSGLTQVTGSATDDNFLRYELSIAAGDSNTYTPIGQGASGVTNGVLGTLDPTVLVNGPYRLRLVAFDAGGNSTTVENAIVVTGQKIGRFAITYRDVSVPVAGLPVQVVRSYDSRDTGVGDFGAGWRLSVNTFRVGALRPLGTRWQVVKQGLSYALVPGGDHLVTITLPGGQVETFDLRVTPTVSALVPFTSLTATLVPLPGTLGTLQSLDNNNLLVLDPQPGPLELVDDITLNTYYPDRYRYTAPDGTQTVVTRSHGVESVRDTNGNQLTIGATGITHTAGPGIAFARDAQGRITSITDPKGLVQGYAYNVVGDLTSHTDATGAVTRYFYNTTHGLVRIEDPLGRPVARTEYDEAGRVVSLTDAAGHTSTVAHDIDGRQEIITDALGRNTVMSYDDRGNVLASTNALGETTTFAYDDQDNIVAQRGPDGVRSTSSYQGALPVTQVVDAGGLDLTTSYSYNGANDVTAVVDSAGRTYAFAYRRQPQRDPHRLAAGRRSGCGDERPGPAGERDERARRSHELRLRRPRQRDAGRSARRGDAPPAPCLHLRCERQSADRNALSHDRRRADADHDELHLRCREPAGCGDRSRGRRDAPRVRRRRATDGRRRRAGSPHVVHLRCDRSARPHRFP